MKFIKPFAVYNWFFRRAFRRLIASAFLGTASFLSLMVFPVRAQADSQYLIPRFEQTVFYGGQEYPLSWLAGPDVWPDADELIIRLNVLSQTVWERSLPPKFPLSCAVKFPVLRPGVITEAQIVITAVSKGKVQAGAFKQRYFVYSRDRGIHWEQVSKDYQIGILDWTETGDLRRFFDDIGVSYTVVQGVADFNGQWLICAGLNFEKRPGLISELYALRQKGVSVLVLPPVKGRFPLPPYQKGESLKWGDEDIWRTCDKRLDLRTIEDGNSSSGVVFQADMIGDQPGICTGKGIGGYSTVILKNRAGEMILCGQDLAELHDVNPAASALIYYLVSHNQTNREQGCGNSALLW